jgi:hypothetical protein
MRRTSRKSISVNMRTGPSVQDLESARPSDMERKILVRLTSEAKLCREISLIRGPFKDRPGSRLLSLCVMRVLQQKASASLVKRCCYDAPKTAGSRRNSPVPSIFESMTSEAPTMMRRSRWPFPTRHRPCSCPWNPAPLPAVPSLRVKTHPPASQPPLP